MALSITTLSADMKTNLETNFAWPVSDPVEIKKFTDALAKAIVDHFVASAELNNAVLDTDTTTVSVDPVTHAGTGTVDDTAVSGGII